MIQQSFCNNSNNSVVSCNWLLHTFELSRHIVKYTQLVKVWQMFLQSYDLWLLDMFHNKGFWNRPVLRPLLKYEYEDRQIWLRYWKVHIYI